MSRIRIGIVGAGGIGGAHLKAYDAWPERCQIVGIADIDAHAANARAAEVDCPAFTDYAQMFADAQPDAISICTPPHLHLPVARAAAARNIHVLCEKPPARTLAETQELVAAMDASTGILQFAFCHRFHQPVQQARALLAAGKLGQLVQIENRFGFRFARAGHSWFTEREIAGGGILIDTLVHSIDIFRALAGEVQHVSAATSTTLPIDVEDSAAMVVTSERGVIGTLTCSWVTPISESVVRIYGTEGQAVIDYAQPDGLRYRLAGDETWTHCSFDAPDRFVQQADQFLHAIAHNGPPPVTGEDGLAVMRVIETAYRSAMEKKTL